MPTEDGRLEVALAIRMTTDLVTVDATQVPFRTKPSNLFDLKFKSKKVGIDDTQMALFKGNLKLLLPEIDDVIDKIDDNSNIVIEDVAIIVETALSKDE